MAIQFASPAASGDRWATITDEAWHESALGDWRLALRIVSQDGHGVVAELRVFPNQETPDRIPGTWDTSRPVPEGGLRDKEVRDIRLDLRISETLRNLAQAADQMDQSEVAAARAHNDPFLINNALIDAGFHSPFTAGTRHPSHKSPGRDANVEDLLFYATRYVHHVGRGVQNPHVAVAREFLGDGASKAEISLEAVRIGRRVGTARKHGLITESHHTPIAGGDLTTKAKTLLAELGHDPRPAEFQNG